MHFFRNRLLPAACVGVLLLCLLRLGLSAPSFAAPVDDKPGLAHFVAAILAPSQLESPLMLNDEEWALSSAADSSSTSTCSSGDGFMSCRTDNPDKARPDLPDLFAVLNEGQYPADLCELDCTASSACYQLGLCALPLSSSSPSSSTSSSSRGTEIPPKSLQIYKPALVALPEQPQSTHLLSSLLGPSSKTTLLLRAFAQSIYKLNTSNDPPISTFTVRPPQSSTELASKPTAIRITPSLATHDPSADSESNALPLSKEVEPADDKTTEKSTGELDIIPKIPVTVQEKVQPILEDGQAHSPEEPETRKHDEELEQPDQLDQLESSQLSQDSTASGEAKHSPMQSQKQNKSLGIATRLNVRQVLEDGNHRSSSCLGLVIAMLCFVGMGM
ncbi:hypothetical protein BZA70DRAFT_174299 [Myxozyma melibiosi]|uniref:Uncharacterized protein n=1 Tax=Myxozyma melibiosi TaxID=54550 RepID=A0ABR1F5L0_9ASCO